MRYLRKEKHMKSYNKPEVKMVEFATEIVADDGITGETGGASTPAVEE